MSSSNDHHYASVGFDEVTAGWRLHSGGSHLLLGITPDIAVFAKAISNGYPMAAIIGTGDAMQAAQDTFVSSTYWTERIGPAAAGALGGVARGMALPAQPPSSRASPATKVT